MACSSWMAWTARGWRCANRFRTARTGSNIIPIAAYFFRPDGVLHSHVNFTDEEARAIVEETHRLGHKVAAHSIGSDGIAASLRAGVDSIEHGDGFTEALLDQAVKQGVYWCPTVMVGAYVAPGTRRKLGTDG